MRFENYMRMLVVHLLLFWAKKQCVFLFFLQETYTRVLKGHIQLARAVFPRGTRGHVLDVLARTSLWEIGLEYLHGTGHGVGAFLNVHEGKFVYFLFW